jgi:hypothetical protein
MGLTFSALCRTHAALDLALGAAMVLALDKTAEAAHGKEAAEAVFGGTANKAADKVALRVSESLAGVLLIDIGLLLGIIATAKDRAFQRNVCYAALSTYALMAAFRLTKQSQVEALRKDVPGQLVGDAVMAASWAWWLWKN